MRFPYLQSRQVISFGLVGAIGFGCDAALFLLLSQNLAIAVLPARAMAFVPATIVTWLLNRYLVFKTGNGRRRKRDEYGRYILIQCCGIAINFAVFYVAVKLGLGRHSAQLVPLVLGSGVAMFFNFVGAKHFVFLHPR